VSAALHLVRMDLDGRALFTFARKQGLALHDTDLGYLVHAWQAAVFGDEAPAPFALGDDPRRPALRDEARSPADLRRLTVLGYSARDDAALRTHVDAFCLDPQARAACDWQTFASKPMPDVWVVGRRLGFVVRVCPVVRGSRGGGRRDEGAEVDAFLAACDGAAADAGLRREPVYREWLGRQFEARGARLVHAELSRFALARLARRNHGEGRRLVLTRPDATLLGEIEVTDPAQFRALLARGVGRHRAFGFGMLLLRPARSSTLGG
jgi:CRISPR system Cascade subunit CasE